MNNVELLQKIVNAIKESAGTTSNKIDVSIIGCMTYLLGEENEGCLTNNALYNIFKGSNLSKTHLEALAKSKDWSIERLEFCLIKGSKETPVNQETFEDKILLLLSEYHITGYNKEEISSMVMPLIYFCFFGTPVIEPLFCGQEKCGCSTYVSRPDLEQKILNFIKSSSLLFMTGDPASGKKQLLIHVLKEYMSSAYPDVYWLDAYNAPGRSLEKRFFQIKFAVQETDKPSLEKIINLLRQKTSTAVLVIDIPYITQEDFTFIQSYLTDLKVRVIIITRCRTIPACYDVIDIGRFPSEKLIQLFHQCQLNSSADWSDEDLMALFSIVDYNPYIVTLIAKSLSQNTVSLTKEKLLNRSDWIWNENALPILHSSYPNSSDKSAQQLTTLICRILSSYPSDFLNNYASELSVWTKHPIEQTLLEKYFDPAVIFQAIAYGILLHSDQDNDKLYMPGLIADAIWKQCPIDYNDYKSKIIEFLHIIETGKPFILPYEDLYQIIFYMILRFHHQVTTMPSRITTEAKAVFQEWNHTLTEIIEHYMILGNWKFAQETLSYLYTSQNKKGVAIAPTKSQQYIQQLLRAQTGYMQSNDFSVSLTTILQVLMDWKADYDSLSSKNKQTEETHILFLAQLIIQDLANHIISITLKAAASHWTDAAPVDFHTFQRNIMVLQQCSIHLINNGFPDGYYCMSACHFLAALYSGYGELCHATSCPNHLLANQMLSPELHFKSECLCFYYRLFEFYIRLEQNLIAAPHDFFCTYAQEYDRLYTNFHHNMWSYHTSFLFYSCTILLQLFLPEQDFPDTCQKLKKSMELYKRFNSRQLSLSKEQEKEFNQKTDSWLSFL